MCYIAFHAAFRIFFSTQDSAFIVRSSTMKTNWQGKNFMALIQLEFSVFCHPSLRNLWQENHMVLYVGKGIAWEIITWGLGSSGSPYQPLITTHFMLHPRFFSFSSVNFGVWNEHFIYPCTYFFIFFIYFLIMCL